MIDGIITRGLALKWATLLLAAYIGFCLLLFVAQRRLIFLPSRSAMPLPPGFSEWLLSDSGEAWGYKRVSGSRECLFFFHGNGGNASGWAHAVAEFPGDVFVLEYPGYGTRPGSPSEQSIKAAARQGFEAEHGPYDKIVVAGQSLGAAVTEAIFSRWPDRIHRLVLITPFVSLSEMARHQFSFVPVSWILRDKMELYEPWRKFPGRTKIVIAGADEIVPRAQSLRFLAENDSRISALELPGRGHNEVNLDARFWSEVLSE